MIKANLKRTHTDKMPSEVERTKSGNWWNTIYEELNQNKEKRKKKAGALLPLIAVLIHVWTARQDDDEPTSNWAKHLSLSATTADIHTHTHTHIPPQHTPPPPPPPLHHNPPPPPSTTTTTTTLHHHHPPPPPPPPLHTTTTTTLLHHHHHHHHPPPPPPPHHLHHPPPPPLLLLHHTTLLLLLHTRDTLLLLHWQREPSESSDPPEKGYTLLEPFRERIRYPSDPPEKGCTLPVPFRPFRAVWKQRHLSSLIAKLSILRWTNAEKGHRRMISLESWRMRVIEDDYETLRDFTRFYET